MDAFDNGMTDGHSSHRSALRGAGGAPSGEEEEEEEESGALWAEGGAETMERAAQPWGVGPRERMPV